MTDLPANALVMEYCGEVLTHGAFAARKKRYSRENIRHFYFMSLNADEVIDATLRGTLSRFINHSCEPNCETQKWLVEGCARNAICLALLPLTALPRTVWVTQAPAHRHLHRQAHQKGRGADL